MNVIGPQIRKLRSAREWTQDTLAARCGVLGWDLSRATLAKVEARVRCVTDAELHVLASALRVDLQELFPKNPVAIRDAVAAKSAPAKSRR